MYVLLCAAAVLALGALHNYREDRKLAAYLQRNPDRLNNMLESESKYAQIMSRINDLIEVFGKTRDLDAVLNRAMEALDEVFEADALLLQLYNAEGRISIIIGISDCSGDAGNAEDLVSVADEALYYGKCHGRNQIVRARENREAIEKESTDRRKAEKNLI